jgi:hypothetical protein
MITNELQLLEQHDHYQLGEGFSLGRRQPGQWCLYFRAIHVQAREAEFSGHNYPESEDLQTFETVPQAMKVFRKLIRANPRWLRQARKEGL